MYRGRTVRAISVHLQLVVLHTNTDISVQHLPIIQFSGDIGGSQHVLGSIRVTVRSCLTHPYLIRRDIFVGEQLRIIPVRIPVVAATQQVVAKATGSEGTALIFTVDTSIENRSEPIGYGEFMFVVGDYRGAMILQFLVITHRVRDIVVRLFRTVLVKDGVHDLTIRLTVGGEGIARRPIYLVDILSQGMHTADLPGVSGTPGIEGIPTYGYSCRNNSSFLPFVSERKRHAG